MGLPIARAAEETITPNRHQNHVTTQLFSGNKSGSMSHDMLAVGTNSVHELHNYGLGGAVHARGVHFKVAFR